MWFLVFLGSIILKLILSPILLSYGIYRAFREKRLEEYFKQMSIKIDVLGNVMGKDIFNKTLREKEGYSFGNNCDTISYSMAINKRFNNLSKFGKLIEKLLNFVDNNHLEKSIKYHD